MLDKFIKFLVIALLIASSAQAQEKRVLRYDNVASGHQASSEVSVDDSVSTETLFRIPASTVAGKTGAISISGTRNDDAGFADFIGADDSASSFTFTTVQEFIDSVLSANPSAEVDGTAVNGSATTYMRSDAAPALADPFTPADGTQNITGALTVSGAIAGSNLSGTNTGDISSANPTASVDGTAVNGSAGTWMRSDAAPALADPLTPADGVQNVTGGLKVDAPTDLSLDIRGIDVTSYEAESGFFQASDSANTAPTVRIRQGDSQADTTKAILVEDDSSPLRVNKFYAEFNGDLYYAGDLINEGPISINSGGTNSTAGATAGGVAYGTGTAYAFTSAGTAGLPLISAGASAPSFSSNLVLGSANYDIFYRAPTTGYLTALAAGTDGYVLTTHGTSSAPTWSAASGGTDRAIIMLGKSGTISASGTWLETPFGTTSGTAKGIPVARSGSLVGYAINHTISGVSGSVFWLGRVYVNGSNVWANAGAPVSSNATYNHYAVQGSGVDTVSAGDMISADMYKVYGTGNTGDVSMIIEIQY